MQKKFYEFAGGTKLKIKRHPGSGFDPCTYLKLQQSVSIAFEDGQTNTTRPGVTAVQITGKGAGTLHCIDRHAFAKVVR